MRGVLQIPAKAMSNTPPASWSDWIHAFRERFIAKQGWTEKEAKLRIRDAWAVVRDGRIHVLTEGDQRPVDAVPVFRTLTAGRWKLPIEIHETPDRSRYESNVEPTLAARHRAWVAESGRAH